MEMAATVVKDAVAYLRRIEKEASPEWNYTLHLLLSEKLLMALCCDFNTERVGFS